MDDQEYDLEGTLFIDERRIDLERLKLTIEEATALKKDLERTIKELERLIKKAKETSEPVEKP